MNQVSGTHWTGSIPVGLLLAAWTVFFLGACWVFLVPGRRNHGRHMAARGWLIILAVFALAYLLIGTGN